MNTPDETVFPMNDAIPTPTPAMPEVSDQKPYPEPVRCRVTICGTYKGAPFTYTDPEDSKGSQFIWDGDPSTYWWAEGNFSCDCNRSEFVPEAPRHKCGGEILIDSIVPLDPSLPALYLDET